MRVPPFDQHWIVSKGDSARGALPRISLLAPTSVEREKFRTKVRNMIRKSPGKKVELTELFAGRALYQPRWLKWLSRERTGTNVAIVAAALQHKCFKGFFFISGTPRCVSEHFALGSSTGSSESGATASGSAALSGGGGSGAVSGPAEKETFVFALASKILDGRRGGSRRKNTAFLKQLARDTKWASLTVQEIAQWKFFPEVLMVAPDNAEKIGVRLRTGTLVCTQKKFRISVDPVVGSSAAQAFTNVFTESKRVKNLHLTEGHRVSFLLSRTPLGYKAIMVDALQQESQKKVAVPKQKAAVANVEGWGDAGYDSGSVSDRSDASGWDAQDHDGADYATEGWNGVGGEEVVLRQGLGHRYLSLAQAQAASLRDLDAQCMHDLSEFDSLTGESDLVAAASLSTEQTVASVRASVQSALQLVQPTPVTTGSGLGKDGTHDSEAGNVAVVAVAEARAAIPAMVSAEVALDLTATSATPAVPPSVVPSGAAMSSLAMFAASNALPPAGSSAVRLAVEAAAALRLSVFDIVVTAAGDARAFDIVVTISSDAPVPPVTRMLVEGRYSRNADLSPTNGARSSLSLCLCLCLSLCLSLSLPLSHTLTLVAYSPLVCPPPSPSLPPP